MATYVINQDKWVQTVISGTGDRWIVAAGTTFDTNDQAVSLGGEQNTFEVSGRVLSTGPYDAVVNYGTSNVVTVNEGGLIRSSGGAGVVFDAGEDNILNNDGRIIGKTFGFLGSDSDIEISNSGLIKSSGIALKTGSEANTGLELDNSGIIRSTGSLAILGGEGVEKIVNTGVIDGNVRLGGGDDDFDFATGTVHGKVYGGEGDDTYRVGKQSAGIVEAVDAGWDLVWASRDYKLGANIESLTLDGKSDLNGSGNDLANIIEGNAGDNILRAGAGSDRLFGSGGHNDLYGGQDSDTFYMMSGRDRVMDFQVKGNEHDLIDISGVTAGSGSAMEVFDHMTQHGNDVWIDFDDARMILRDVDMDDLSQSHFITDMS